jgi:hypothetical protein
VNDSERDLKDQPAETSAARPNKARIDKARLDRVFGDVLPETTGDERGPGADRGRSDEDYVADRPPHHGG